MRRKRPLSWLWALPGRVTIAAAALLSSFFAVPARAEPYLAVQQGYQCSQCHVNPTGGGLRNDFGAVFSQNVLPAHSLPGDMPAWTGKIGDIVRLGGDLREDWTRTDVPNQDTQQAWDLQEARVYGAVEPIRNRLFLVIDESLAPGNAETREAYVRYADPEQGWYIKGGRFYLPFGWRLEDDSAFVRQVSGINMTTPDDGIELGYERPSLSMQLDLTNGAANAGSGSGYQATGQVAWVQTRGRIGLAASYTDANAGNRSMAGLFGGLRTGPIAWLGEVDYIRDEGFPEGTRTLVAALGEVDWAWRKGHNVKLTAEYFDPDRNVSEDQKTRWSAVYEYTPVPFLQLRAGFRQYDGIPQNDVDNRNVAFFELHGFF
jgi:hypothetical protein